MLVHQTFWKFPFLRSFIRAMSSSPLFGIVTAFDERRGLGDITDDSGRVWPFHCAEIADGSRRINLGQRVSFTTKFHITRDEAFGIFPA